MSTIHIVFGPQGAGKSTYSKKLSKEVEAVHFSIDDWMWKLFGADMPKPINLKWIMERVERCENKIWEVASDIANYKGDVILDLGFTKFAKRQKFIKLAEAHGVKTQVHYLKAPLDLRRKRVLHRNNIKGETFSFEVTPGMFDFMEGEFQVPTKSELDGAIVVDTK